MPRLGMLFGMHFVAVPYRILLVEDDLSLAQALTSCLDGIGIETEHCSSAEVAIELLRANRYPLLVVDIILGAGLSGVYVVDAVRKLPQEERPAVLVMTGASLDFIRGINRQVVTAILIKPIDFDLFCEYVRATVEHAVKRLPRQPATTGARRTIRTFCGSCDSEIPAWVGDPREISETTSADDLFAGWMDMPCRTCGNTPRERPGRSEL
jgi:two-component system, chemotaxis family, chemotaxis protein CheY